MGDEAGMRTARSNGPAASARPVAKGDSPVAQGDSQRRGREPVEGRAEPTPPAHSFGSAQDMPSRASGRAGREVGAAPEGGIEPVRVRIGLHTGEAIKEGTYFFGKHVNLAARVAGQTAGGQILVSSLLKELTESGGDVEFGERREVKLKGLTGTHHLYQIRWE